MLHRLLGLPSLSLQDSLTERKITPDQHHHGNFVGKKRQRKTLFFFNDSINLEELSVDDNIMVGIEFDELVADSALEKGIIIRVLAT